MHASATRADVAKRAGVSGPTVSRALCNSPLIPQRTKDRIQRIAGEMGYVPSTQASLFAKKKSFRLGFVIPLYHSFPPFSRAYFPSLLDGVVLGAEERGYSVTILLDDKEGKPRDLTREVKSRAVDGIILATSIIKDGRVRQLKNDNMPFVIINGRERGCTSVDNNPSPGMKQAFEYFTRMEHWRIAYISGDKQYQNAVDRLAVFNELAREFGVEAEIIEGNFSKTSGYRCAAKLLQRKQKPSLIMASSDREAIGVINYCRDHHISIPEEVSVIGYDNLDPAGLITPALTTVHNPIREIGAEGARILINQIEKKSRLPVSKNIDTGFVIRESSGKCM